MGSEWRPYTERAPEGVPLLLMTAQGQVCPGRWCNALGFVGLTLGVQVAFWMEVPHGE